MTPAQTLMQYCLAVTEMPTSVLFTLRNGYWRCQQGKLASGSDTLFDIGKK